MKAIFAGNTSRTRASRARFPQFVVAIAIAAGFTTACERKAVIDPVAATLSIAPNPATLAISATQQFVATAADLLGINVTVVPVWSIVAGGGTISSTGLFTAGTTSGTFSSTVKATSGSLSALATVIVNPGALATITVTPNPVTMPGSTAQQFIAIGKDAGGNVVGIIPVWTVVNGGGTIGTAGLFTSGTLAGAYANTVKATSGAISGTATVNVTAGALATITVTPNPKSLISGTTQIFTATGQDAAGNAVAITPAWSVVNGGGSIDASSGLFTAGGVNGTFNNTVRAASGTISGTATVTVTGAPPVLTTITVTPNPATLNTGATQQFTAVGRDADGNVMAITPVWSVVNGGGTTNATGLFTAGAVTGTFSNTVKATSGTVSGTATVIVTAPLPVLTTITVTPNPATMNTNATQQFTAVGRDQNGNVMAITPVWSVVNGGGLTDANGLFTAGAVAGTFSNTMKATSGTVSGTATVIVTAPTPVLATITVSPNPATMNANSTQLFTAVGRDAGGNIVAITPTWSVVNGGGSIDSNTGLFTAGPAGGTFNNTIKATSGTISGTATVTVLRVLTTITVTPNPATMNTNASEQFTAVGRDANGLVMPIVPVWSVVNGGGTTNPAGLFTAGAVAGTFLNTMKATSGTVSGTATVIVVAIAPPLVPLGAAGPFGILAGTAVTCVTGGIINADVGVSPGSTVTGFGPCVITGVQHLNDATAVQAQIDLTTAYNQLVGMPCPPANAIVANLGGTTKLPGVYCSGSSIGVTGVLTLNGNGDPNSTFVFQAGSTLTTAGSILLINGAQARNVYWQVGSSATIGTASAWKGNILAQASISLIDNATLIGRALARTGAVTLTIGNIITLP